MTVYNILLVFWDYIIRNVIIVDNEKGFLFGNKLYKRRKSELIMFESLMLLMRNRDYIFVVPKKMQYFISVYILRFVYLHITELLQSGRKQSLISQLNYK